MKQNLTLSLEKDLIKKMKILAAHHETTVTGLVAEYIEKMAIEEQIYQSSKAGAKTAGSSER